MFNPNFNKKLSVNDLLELICYNLGQYKHLQEAYDSSRYIYDYNEFVEEMGERVHDWAKNKMAKIKEYRSILNREKSKEKRLYLEYLIQQLQNTPYDIYRTADNKSFAKAEVKRTLLLSDFEFELAPQKTNARSFDSCGRSNLFQTDEKKSVEQSLYYYSYRAVKSMGPMVESTLLSDHPSQDSVGMLICAKKPQKQMNHQIWINDHLMLKSTFKTKESLSSYLSGKRQLTDDLLYLISIGEDIYRTYGEHLTPEILNKESKRLRLEYVKRKSENYMEQYGLLAIEQLVQMVQKLKKATPKLKKMSLAFTDRINDIQGIKRPFLDVEKDQMDNYVKIRDHLAHPTEYNFRPFGSQTSQNYMHNFLPDMIEYLATLLNVDNSVIEGKINSVKQDSLYNVRALIMLMDSRKILRNICIAKGNISPDQQDVFKHLNMINKEEKDVISKAMTLRNMLCHGKIDENLARQAEMTALEVLPIITKIAEQVERRYNYNFNSFYFSSRTQNDVCKDFKKEYPFLEISLDNDPDADLFKQAFEERKVKTKGTLDKKLLDDLYSFSLIFQTAFVDKKMKCFFDEKGDILPYLISMDKELKNNQDKSKTRRCIVKGIVNAFVDGHKIPEIQKEN